MSDLDRLTPQTRLSLATSLGIELIKRMPKGATGVYVTSHGIVWGKRTNKAKLPSNYIWLGWEDNIS